MIKTQLILITVRYAFSCSHSTFPPNHNIAKFLILKIIFIIDYVLI